MTKSKWLVLKLSPTGEVTSKGILKDNLRALFGKSCRVFFPFRQIDDPRYTTKALVLEGYIFVQHTHKIEPFVIEKSPYFDLLNSKLEYVSSVYISTLKKKLKDLCEEDFDPGEIVHITDGPYSKMNGEVVVDRKSTVSLKIKTRSRVVLVDLPKIYIERF